jgi:lathosterol oxidase
MDIAHDAIADFVGADKTNIAHQSAIFFGIMLVGAWALYLSVAGASFYHTFVLKADRLFPKTIARAAQAELRRQVLQEIWIAVCSVPFIALIMFPAALFSYRGYSKIYSDVDDYGWWYIPASVGMYLFFTDCIVYWMHRGLHHPLLYRSMHKLHHVYQYTTPFSSHAFHPLDGFTQGVAYYIFIYLVPMHNIVFVVMFAAVNTWTVNIHDQIDLGGYLVNTTGHHTIHHVLFNYCYGQYFTLWDRVGGTYKPATQTHSLFSKLEK